MKIGVISDTHMSTPSEALYNLNNGIFADVDMVLHAGDLTRIDVLDAFAGKEVRAVCGNMDRQDVAARLPAVDVIAIEDYRIGLVHGWGTPRGIEERIMQSFKDVHAIVYGHTHKPFNQMRNGILMFNPGSFSGSFLTGRDSSVGILTVDDGIRGSIINI